MTGEAKNAEEAIAMYKELMAQENALLSEKTELWEKVFMAADKGVGTNEEYTEIIWFVLLQWMKRVSHGSDSLNATRLKDFAYARNLCRHEDSRVHHILFFTESYRCFR